MKNQMLEVGKIVNTHGVRGELKIESWLDDPCLFGELEELVVNGKTYAIQSARVQGKFALVKLEGIHSIDDAMCVKGRVASADREQIPLEEGAHFIADLIGMDAFDVETGEVFGQVKAIHEYPAQDVYEVQGEKTYLIPDVPVFVEGIDDEADCIRFHLMEGLEQ